MPLTTITALEFQKVLAWVEDVYQTDVLKRAIERKDLTEAEVD